MSTIANLKINVIANTRKLSTGLKKAQKDVRGFRSAISKLGKGLAVIGFAAAGAAAFAFQKVLRSVISTFSAFEHAMQEVRSILIDITDEGFVEMTEKAKELGATTVFSATEAAKAMSFLSRAGFDYTETMKAVPATLDLAAAGNLELAEAANITAQVLRGMGLEVSETTRVADVLALTSARTNTTVQQLGHAFGYAGPTAAALGITLEETAAMLGMLSNAGIQADRAGTGLKNIMAELAAEIDANGISALKRFTEGGIGVEEAFAIFQKRGGPAILALDRMSERTAVLTDELGKATNIAKEMARVRMESLVGQLTLLKSKIETLKIEIGERLKPTISALIESLSQLTVAGTTAFDSMVEKSDNAAIRVGVLNEFLLGTITALGWIVTVTGKIGAIFAAFFNIFQMFFRVIAMLIVSVAGLIEMIIGLFEFTVTWDVSKLKFRFNEVRFTFKELAVGIGTDFNQLVDSLMFEKGLGFQMREFAKKTKENLRGGFADADGSGDTPQFIDPEVLAFQTKLEELQKLRAVFEKDALAYEKIYAGESGNRTKRDKELIDLLGIEKIKSAANLWREKAAEITEQIAVLKDSMIPVQSILKHQRDLEAEAKIGEATTDIQDFIKEMQLAQKTIGMTSREIEIFKAKEAGVFPALLDQARALDDILTKEELRVKKADELKAKSLQLIETLKTPAEIYQDTLDELEKMNKKGLINDLQRLRAISLAKEKLDEGIKIDVDTGGVEGIQTALGAVKVGGLNVAEKQLTTAISSLQEQKLINVNLSKLFDQYGKLPFAGGVASLFEIGKGFATKFLKSQMTKKGELGGASLKATWQAQLAGASVAAKAQAELGAASLVEQKTTNVNLGEIKTILKNNGGALTP